jgi:alpha-beta hydrolase superfamily lysophospholipase
VVAPELVTLEVVTPELVTPDSSDCVTTMTPADVSAEFASYVKHLDNTKEGMLSLKVESVSFPVKQSQSSDKTFTRNGFLATRPGAVGTVIICHGYTHSKHEAFFFKTYFPYFNVLAFDFRAHGELTQDQESTIGRDEMHDVYGAVQFVKNNPVLKGKPVIGFGFSMGAVALLMAQAEYENLFDALILDSPFESSTDCMARSVDTFLSYTLFGRTYKLPGKSLIMFSLYNPRMQFIAKPVFKWSSGMNPSAVSTKFVPVIPLATASKIKIPCMFISCNGDKNVATDCVRKLYEAVHSPMKRFWITLGLKHCGSCIAQPEMYNYKINSFIRKALSSDFKVPTKVVDDRVVIKVA